MLSARAQRLEIPLFLQHKKDLFELLPPGHMHTYMADSIFARGRVERWASYVHPGLLTLGIASTQRVESANSALKSVLDRSGTLVDVHEAMVGKVRDDATKTARQYAGGEVQRVRPPTASPFEIAQADWLKRFDFVRDGMHHVGCSAHAMKDMSTEALAGMIYSAKFLATGHDEVQRLLAAFVSNPATAGLCYDTSGVADDVTLTTRTSVEFFADLLENQPVDHLVRITKTFSTDDGPQYCHLVALGPDGFVLCTCLRILVYGLGCRHALRALCETDCGFDGGCIAPRWHKGGIPWKMGLLAAKRATPAITRTGLPGELPSPPADPGVFSHSKPTVRANIWSSCVTFGKELAPLMTEIDTIAASTRILENLHNHAKQLIEVEVRSQHDTSASRVFKGVVARPAIATGLPEGAGGATGPGGGRGKGNTGGKQRGGAKGRGRGGSKGKGGRGGASHGTPGTGMPSPDVGFPAVLHAPASGATSGGERVGGSGLDILAPSMPSPGAGVQAFRDAAGAGAAVGLSPTATNGARAIQSSGIPLRSLSNAPRGGVGGFGQAPLGLVSSSSNSTNSCEPETFHQARLNGEIFRANENRDQPLAATLQDVAFLDQIQTPAPQKHTGQAKRRTSTQRRNTRGGGQHVIQGGAQGAWGV